MARFYLQYLYVSAIDTLTGSISVTPDVLKHQRPVQQRSGVCWPQKEAEVVESTLGKSKRIKVTISGGENRAGCGRRGG